MADWQQKVVLVTGGSDGLGLAIARAFAERKARIALAARTPEKLAAAAETFRACGGEVHTIAADVTQQADVERMIAATIERFGRLDVLVNNAGRSARGEVLSTTAADFAELLELNFLSAVRCTLAAAPHLLSAGGHVVNIGSLAAKSATRYMGAYPASKYPLAAYSQQLRLELGPRGLHVLLVCPGPIARSEPREYANAADLPEAARKPGAGVKVSRLTPESVATAVVRGCERRQAELVLPGKARLLFALAQLSPRLGDWLLVKMTS